MTIADTITQYEALRMLLLGSEAGIGIAQPRPSPGSSDFDAFVSSSYVALRETLADDASFLSSADVLGRHEATLSVFLLRTARQHDDNQGAVRFYEQWVGTEPIDWDDAVGRLVQQVEDYLRKLVEAAQVVRRSPALHARWVASDSVSTPSIFDAVCRDLNLSFAHGARKAKVRAIEARYRRDGLARGKKRMIADLCVQEALSESGILPVAYSDLLDEMGLIRSRDAAAAVALAYATARALPRLKGEDFKRKVSEMWWSLVRAS